MKAQRKPLKPWQRLVILACLLVMIACIAYALHWELTRTKIERDNAAISALYENAATTPETTATTQIMPTATASTQPTPEPTATSTPKATAAALPSTTVAIANDPTATIGMTAEPAATPDPSPTLAPTLEAVLDATRAPLATADAETIVYAMETPPPSQMAFDDLLFINPETVGFLRIGDRISLPVVQRPNDNEFYLNHNFSGEESIAGTLFLDGSNLIVPEDDSLIVYGHNMRNGTMFHSLCAYDQLPFLKEHAVIRFDTLYQNRHYVPFAVLSVSADPESEYYVDIRQFAFDEASFDIFVDDLRSRSVWNIPVDVAYGDDVLLLVTCEYVHDNGRFVVAFRAIRENERLDAMHARVQNTKAK